MANQIDRSYNSPPVRSIFCGTPAIAVPALDALTEVSEVVGVVCQPDRPAGRGMKLAAPAVKSRALERGLEVFQPTKVRDGSLARWMAERDADVALVIAYGRILDEQVLDTPRLGCVNLHASLLPRYRGAAPIQRALMAGEQETGICLMQMDPGMDTGPVLSTHRLAIAEDDDAGRLALKLSQLAADVTRLDLPRLLKGELTPHPQDHAAATWAPPLSKDEGNVDWTRPAEHLHHLVRGFAPRPGAFSSLLREQPKRLKILRTRIAGDAPRLEPGIVKVLGGRILVGTGTQPLLIQQAQLEGRKAQNAEELVHGRALTEGDRLGSSTP